MAVPNKIWLILPPILFAGSGLLSLALTKAILDKPINQEAINPMNVHPHKLEEHA